ncbi:MAG: hypothetical protein OJJ21_22225 [Ferrovibrio sp.]|uniref:hypothetical protein n=1 Tax=Ferrovibrio sp. TaxID=1917215 RepID=UPI0026193624|nr:hypothetical protein [Ferrovibrio sp.]MCW0236331.1 hypothetical protein [Ferrovibrio sp.]
MAKLGEWAGTLPSEARRDLHEGLGDGRVEIVFGKLPDGTMVHVQNVERGKKCNCVCAACDRPLVAYKRPPMALHFKHAAEEKKGCKTGPETNMHFYAKQLVHRKKRLFVPALDVEYDGVRKLVSKGQVVDFDTSDLEPNLKEIVPDVLLTKQGRQLYVEISVTHPCDDAKIEEIRKRNVSTLEIYLGNYPLPEDTTDLDKVILEHAQRRWVFHRKEDEEIKALKQKVEDEKAAAEARRRSRIIQPILKLPNRNQDDWKLSPYYRKCADDGLENYVGLRMRADYCFRASTKLWQSMLLSEWIVPNAVGMRQYYNIDLFQACRWLTEQRAIQSGLMFAPSDDDLAILRSERPDYRPPMEVVVEYLRALAKSGLVAEVGGHKKVWAATNKLSSMVERAREGRKRRDFNLEFFDQEIEKIRPAVLKEKRYFDFDDWVHWKQDGFGVSFHDALHNGTKADSMLSALQEVARMVERRSQVADNLLMLPLQRTAKAIGDEIEGRRKKAEQERLERERQTELERIEKARLAAEERVAYVTDCAAKRLTDAATWLQEKRKKFGGKSALELAAEGYEGRHTVEREIEWLYYEQKRRENEEYQREQTARHFRDLLEKAARVVYSPERLPWFLNSRHTEFGMSPMEYCVNQYAYDRCLLLLKKAKGKEKRY